MKNNVKRSVYLILLAIILFSASMSIPALYNSRWKDATQGGAAGLFIAGVMTIVFPILLKPKKKA
ncbi:MAG: hypothetical protein ACXVAY_06005 [Mucilaginibacter sp.]